MSFTHSRINASHVFNLYIYNSVRLLWLKSSARNHRNYLINELNLIERVFFHHALLHTIFVFITSILKSLVIPAILLALSTVIYSRIALFLLQITSVLNCVIHVLNRIIFVLNRNIFALYRISFVSITK